MRHNARLMQVRPHSQKPGKLTRCLLFLEVVANSPFCNPVTRMMRLEMTSQHTNQLNSSAAGFGISSFVSFTPLDIKAY